MKKSSGNLRILLVAAFVLAAVAMPWVRLGFSGHDRDFIQRVSSVPDASTEPCCCGESAPCPCCVNRGTKSDLGNPETPCTDCRCGQAPANSETPSLFLVLAGVAPVGWNPPPPIEIVTAPATPIASACRILARCLPVTDTAQRLALTGVRTT